MTVHSKNLPIVPSVLRPSAEGVISWGTETDGIIQFYVLFHNSQLHLSETFPNVAPDHNGLIFREWLPHGGFGRLIQNP